MNSLETVPRVWDDTRDSAFFRLTSQLFPASFAAGASVLLGSYDGEPTQDPPTTLGYRRDQNSGSVTRQCTAG